MKKILDFGAKMFMKDNRFEVKNDRKIALVIGETGEGKSSLVNFLTKKNECKVSDSCKPCTAEYKMVDIYENNCTYYFVDTPGLNDPEEDAKNIEVIKKFKNAVPRINAIIFCADIHRTKFFNGVKQLIKLIIDLFPAKDLFEHFFIVRTKANRTDLEQFEKDKNRCKGKFLEGLVTYLENNLKEKNINIPNEIKEYYIDSVKRDKDSEQERLNLLDLINIQC